MCQKGPLVESANEFVTPATSPHQWEARAALLQIIAAAPTAHLTTDVDLLLAHDADPLLAVRDGAVELVSRADSTRRFTESFRGATYQQWEYLEPPSIRIAGDASMAWVISRVRVRRTKQHSDGTTQEQGFVYAGLDTYEMREGMWVRTANTSTFVEG